MTDTVPARLVSVGTLDAMRSTVSFLTSVIRCGEPMTHDVQQTIDNFHSRMDALLAEPQWGLDAEYNKRLMAHIRQEDTASGAPKQSGWFG